jgi:hypothetical protein
VCVCVYFIVIQCLCVCVCVCDTCIFGLIKCVSVYIMLSMYSIFNTRMQACCSGDECNYTLVYI